MEDRIKAGHFRNNYGAKRLLRWSFTETLSWFKEHASEKTKSLTERLKGLSMRQMFRQTCLFFILKSVYFQFYGASVHSQEKFQSKSHRSVCFVLLFTKSEGFSVGEEWENVFCHEFASERTKGLSALFSHFEKLYQKMLRKFTEYSQY